LAKAIKSRLRPQKPPSITSHKPSCWLDMPTHDGATGPQSLTWPSPVS
jgi:hypothetical protein